MADDNASAIAPLGIAALGDVRRRTAHEEVLDRLRHAILGGVIAPGTPLILSELSAKLGVSRTPIREAIRDLTSEGLIDFDSYRSSIVHRPTLKEAGDVYELRIMLEPVAVRRAVPAISAEALDRARELQRLMTETDDIGDWVELNRDFHGILMEPAGSPRLLSIIAGLRNAAAVQVAMSIRARPEQLSHGNEDHARIVEAYARRDADAAAEMTAEHLRSTMRAIEAYERDNHTADAQPPSASA